MTKIFISIGILILCGALFFGTYILNKKTPKPEGCVDLESECKTCTNTACAQKRKGE